MTDYPSIKPEAVREGDVVEVVHQLTVGWQLARTLPHLTDDCYVAGEPVPVTQLRLVSRPTPPEPPLRVGDFVRCTHSNGMTGQIVSIDVKGWHSIQGEDVRWGASGPEVLTRVEPPVGWPVGVPDPDAPGGVEWYRCTGGDEYYVGSCSGVLSWSELVAAGGVPALAVTR